MILGSVIVGICLSTVLAADTQNFSSIIEHDDDSYYPPERWSDILDWKILKFLSEESENILMSPISLKIVLALLYEGSSGSTQREFESGLQFLTKPELRDQIKDTLRSLHMIASNENKIRISTRLFLDSQIKPKNKYIKSAKEFYGADIISTNFSDIVESSDNINQWVDEATFGLVSQLTNPGELQNVIMLIANAVYFKGLWRNQFPKNETCISGFFIKPDKICYIPFMITTDIFYYLESEYLDAQILRLPYKRSEFSMFILLPKAKGGLSGLIQRINLYDLHRQLHFMSKKTVKVSIPRFQFKFKSSYTKILRKFGITKMFQNTATFSGITEGHSSLLRELFVSDIIQSTGIEVDEQGSIAYAATNVVIGNKIGIPDYIFDATHPFLFFVQEEVNGTIIFLGKMENPTVQNTVIKRVGEDFE